MTFRRQQRDEDVAPGGYTVGYTGGYIQGLLFKTNPFNDCVITFFHKICFDFFSPVLFVVSLNLNNEMFFDGRQFGLVKAFYNSVRFIDSPAMFSQFKEFELLLSAVF